MAERFGYDRKYWPKCGAKVPLAVNLDELWETHEEEASVFVAEAIVDSNPIVRIELREPGPTVVVHVWDVGGDSITINMELSQIIVDSANDYDKLYSKEQADDVKEMLGGLDKIEKALAEVRARINKLLEGFDASS